jgi:hypothetical protein
VFRDRFFRHARAWPGHPRLKALAASKAWMASKLGLARVSQILIAVSRASPTYGDKPGHDEWDALRPETVNLIAPR